MPLRSTATIRRRPRATAIAPLRHWLYFLPLYRRSEVGPDGHALRGGFLPPVPLPRRMWAGGRLEFRRPVRVGDAIERTSTIVKVDAKEGRTGALVFVLVRHEIGAAGEVAIVEEHDIVYREAPRAGEPPPAKKAAPANPDWRRDVVPDDVLLFRYSALTFNGHRIHYDRRYVTEVEGYPGLIVHGPLIATLLADLARDMSRRRNSRRSRSARSCRCSTSRRSPSAARATGPEIPSGCGHRMPTAISPWRRPPPCGNAASGVRTREPAS